MLRVGVMTAGWFLVATGLAMAAPERGSVTGRVSFQGSIPSPVSYDVVKDVEFCGKTVTVQPLVVDAKTKGVQGVVVVINGEALPQVEMVDALPIYRISNKDCSFSPRIGTAQKKSSVEISNKDPILHNTHLKLGKRTRVNVAQIPGGRIIRKRLKREGLYRFQCDKHQFMEAYMMVVPHPYFAVTGPEGMFHIEGVPAGNYQVTLWHESLGKIQKDLQVSSTKTARLDVQYP